MSAGEGLFDEAEAPGHDPQQFLEGGLFVVDEHPQGLKRAGGRVQAVRGLLLAAFVVGEGHALDVEDQLDQGGDAAKGFALALFDDAASQETVIRLIGEVTQGVGEGFFGEGIEQVGGGVRAALVHPHVERAVVAVAHAAGRVVDLHTGEAQVCEDDVEALRGGLGHYFSQPGEVAAEKLHRHIGALFDEPFLGAFQLDAVDIEPDELAGRADAPGEGGGMSAITQGAVGDDAAGAGVQILEDFGDHDRHVGAGGGFAFVAEVAAQVGMGLDGVFFVFLGKCLGMRAAVPRPPAMRLVVRVVRCSVGTHLVGSPAKTRAGIPPANGTVIHITSVSDSLHPLAFYRRRLRGKVNPVFPGVS